MGEPNLDKEPDAMEVDRDAEPTSASVEGDKDVPMTKVVLVPESELERKSVREIMGLKRI